MKLASIMILAFCFIAITGCSTTAPSQYASPVAQEESVGPPPTTIPSGYTLKPDAPEYAKEYWQRCKGSFSDPYYIEQSDMRGAVQGQGNGQRWIAVGCGVLEGSAIQIVDDDDLLMSSPGPFDNETDVYWITGMPTGQLIDGSPVKGCFRVVGRKQYDSALGTRTVLLLQPFNIRDYLNRDPRIFRQKIEALKH